MISAHVQVTVDPVKVANLKHQIAILKMPAAKRRKMLRFVAYRLIRDIRKRVRERRDINGMAMAPHPGHTKKQHAIDKVAKLIGITSETNFSANIGWKKDTFGSLPARIHRGSLEYVRDEEKTSVLGAGKSPCSVWQARQLIAYGYRRNGSKKQPLATMRWLRGSKGADGRRVNYNMTFGKAALILDDMRRRGFKKSRSELGASENEKVKIPQRPFLGASQADIVSYIDTIFEQVTKELARGTR